MRLVSPIDLGGMACLLAYGFLAWITRTTGDPSLHIFMGLSVCIAATTFVLYIYYQRHPDQKISLARLIGWSVAFRICGLIGGPFYEDDFYRYLWDAFRFMQDGTPYGLAPEVFFLDMNVPEKFQRLLDGINYPELPTIYGPVTQLVFLAGYGLAPGSVTALQGVMVMIDLMTIVLLLRFAPPSAVLLYAWSPLVIKEIAFTAHPDGVAVFLVIAAILLVHRNRFYGAAIFMGLAVSAKILALLLVPFILVRGDFRVWGVFLLTLMLIYLPFVLQGSTELQTFFVFAREWEFNAALFSLFKPWMPNSMARAVCGLLLATAIGSYYLVYRRQTHGTIVRGDWIYGGLFALWPVVNSWYLLWLLPFAVIRPSTWAWTASVAVLLSYITGLNLGNLDMHPFAHPDWVRPLEYGLILMALAYDILRRFRHSDHITDYNSGN
ncbi:MAG: glycosyltransferase family 87 protein [Bacteroidetes bacterium]|nr:glycosyltransferase family 87 protein [Bacteroidota bacterium]MCY4204919.1 glycosyltransferase family 87 protein [Bacteroidota bacterium]